MERKKKMELEEHARVRRKGPLGSREPAIFIRSLKQTRPERTNRVLWNLLPVPVIRTILPFFIRSTSVYGEITSIDPISKKRYVVVASDYESRMFRAIGLPRVPNRRRKGFRDVFAIMEINYIARICILWAEAINLNICVENLRLILELYLRGYIVTTSDYKSRAVWVKIGSCIVEVTFHFERFVALTSEIGILNSSLVESNENREIKKSSGVSSQFVKFHLTIDRSFDTYRSICIYHGNTAR